MSLRPAADPAGQQRCVGAEEELRFDGADRADPEPGELGHLLPRLPGEGARGGAIIAGDVAPSTKYQMKTYYGYAVFSPENGLFCGINFFCLQGHGHGHGHEIISG